MAGIPFSTDYYIETDLVYLADSPVEPPLPIALIVDTQVQTFIITFDVYLIKAFLYEISSFEHIPGIKLFSFDQPGLSNKMGLILRDNHG